MRTVRFPPNSSANNRYFRTILLVWMLTISLLFLVPQNVQNVHAEEGVTIHVVTTGDNLSTIARRYGVSVATLMDYNNIGNANIIRLGQQIRIPATIQPVPAGTPVPTAATQNEPESVTSSSTPPTTSNGTPAAQTESESKTPSNTPTPTPAPVPASLPYGGEGTTGYTAAGEPVYTVRRGDTLSGIASQFGVTVSSILQRNGLGSLVILVSQRLIIPFATTMPTPTSVYRPSSEGDITPTARAQSTPTSRLYNYFTVADTPTPWLRLR